MHFLWVSKLKKREQNEAQCSWEMSAWCMWPSWKRLWWILAEWERNEEWEAVCHFCLYQMFSWSSLGHYEERTAPFNPLIEHSSLSPSQDPDYKKPFASWRISPHPSLTLIRSKGWILRAKSGFFWRGGQGGGGWKHKIQSGFSLELNTFQSIMIHDKLKTPCGKLGLFLLELCAKDESCTILP